MGVFETFSPTGVTLNTLPGFPTDRDAAEAFFQRQQVRWNTAFLTPIVMFVSTCRTPWQGPRTVRLASIPFYELNLPVLGAAPDLFGWAFFEPVEKSIRKLPGFCSTSNRNFDYNRPTSPAFTATTWLTISSI